MWLNFQNSGPSYSLNRLVKYLSFLYCHFLFDHSDHLWWLHLTLPKLHSLVWVIYLMIHTQMLSTSDHFKSTHFTIDFAYMCFVCARLVMKRDKEKERENDFHSLCSLFQVHVLNWPNFRVKRIDNRQPKHTLMEHKKKYIYIYLYTQ